jgi:hypothetical protein
MASSLLRPAGGPVGAGGGRGGGQECSRRWRQLVPPAATASQRPPGGSRRTALPQLEPGPAPRPGLAVCRLLAHPSCRSRRPTWRAPWGRRCPGGLRHRRAQVSACQGRSGRRGTAGTWEGGQGASWHSSDSRTSAAVALGGLLEERVHLQLLVVRDAGGCSDLAGLVSRSLEVVLQQDRHAGWVGRMTGAVAVPAFYARAGAIDAQMPCNEMCPAHLEPHRCCFCTRGAGTSCSAGLRRVIRN